MTKVAIMSIVTGEPFEAILDKTMVTIEK